MHTLTDLSGDAGKLRLGALTIDLWLSGLLALVTGRLLSDEGTGVQATAIITIFLGYFFVQEGLWAATLGKRVFGLRVLRVDGSPAGWRESAIRTVLRVLEVNPILIGGLPAVITILATDKNQRLGDLLARTVVARPVVPSTISEAFS